MALPIFALADQDYCSLMLLKLHSHMHAFNIPLHTLPPNRPNDAGLEPQAMEMSIVATHRSHHWPTIPQIGCMYARKDNGEAHRNVYSRTHTAASKVHEQWCAS